MPVKEIVNLAGINSLLDTELFVGLIGPIGVALKEVRDKLEEEFGELFYKPVVIKVSTCLLDIQRYKTLKVNKLSEYDRLDFLMQAGDHLRSKTNRSDALLMNAIPSIRNARRKITRSPQKPALRTVYIIDSIKHPNELKLLRKIYGKQFLSIGVFDTRENRVNFLSQRLAKLDHGCDASKYRPKAEFLIERDYNTNGGMFSQNMRDAFPLSDVFIKIEDKDKIGGKLKRILESWFGNPFHTPLATEYGMFLAKSASLRSADLSRQVGASILNDNGDVLAVGCNEVPNAFGKTTWEGDDNDKRDFRIGYDSSAIMKDEIVGEVLKRLKENKFLDAKFSKHSVESLTKSVLYDGKNAILKGTRAANIIEFGRVVHAEMTAITDAARRGVSTQGSTMYVTTFPCHMCARHIIAAGIKQIIYIEPYPKSMARDLYRDIISVDGGEMKDVVKFDAFEGVSPLQYMEFFELGDKERKDKQGQAQRWQKESSCPKSNMIFPVYLESEIIVVKQVMGTADFGYMHPSKHPFKRTLSHVQ